MTHIVISQTWLRDGEEFAQAYVELVERFDDFLRAQPGFVSRRLVRSLGNPRHIIHIREFEHIKDYEAMTAIPEYRDQIAALSELVDADAYPPGAIARTYGEVVFDTDPS